MMTDGRGRKGNPQVAARVPAEVAERLDRVATAMNANQVPGAPVAERTDAVRAVLLAGLPVLEARLGLSPAPPAAAPAQKGGKKPPRKA